MAAKSQEENPNLPGTIYSVAREIEALVRPSFSLRCAAQSAALPELWLISKAQTQSAHTDRRGSGTGPGEVEERPAHRL